MRMVARIVVDSFRRNANPPNSNPGIHSNEASCSAPNPPDLPAIVPAIVAVEDADGVTVIDPVCVAPVVSETAVGVNAQVYPAGDVQLIATMPVKPLVEVTLNGTVTLAPCATLTVLVP